MITAMFTKLSASRTPAQLSLINTRVMLDTGVNLKDIRPEQDNDAATAAKVRSVLREMGVA